MKIYMDSFSTAGLIYFTHSEGLERELSDINAI